MRVVLDCIPCYLKQVISTLNQSGFEEERARQLIHSVFPVIAELGPERSPAENSTIVLRLIYKLTGNADPFRQAKEDSNRLALRMLPQLRDILATSADPLYTACLVSVAGNVIDMGILPDYDVEASLREALSSTLAKNDYLMLQESISSSKQILFIGDNSGEIVFDRLLVEQLKGRGAEVTYAVKGEPILNDATREDAETVGMGEVARVITNGNGFLGTILANCSPEFRAVLSAADLVISKGQANYESLESTKEAGGKTFFLLRAKCPIVAASLGVKLDDIVLKKNEAKW